MRDVVLSHRCVHLNFNPAQEQAAAVRAKLQLACQRSANVHLTCVLSPDDQTSQTMVLSGAAAAVGHRLAAITSVTLKVCAGTIMT